MDIASDEEVGTLDGGSGGPVGGGGVGVGETHTDVNVFGSVYTQNRVKSRIGNYYP